MDEGKFFLVLIVIAIGFLTLMSGSAIYAEHSERMACIEARGNMVGGACVFAPELKAESE